MTLKDVAAPAIRCARNGFGTSYTGALTMYDNSVERKMRLSEAFRKLYLKEDGSFYRFGEIQKNQEIADLLENIAEHHSFPKCSAFQPVHSLRSAVQMRQPHIPDMLFSLVRGILVHNSPCQKHQNNHHDH